MSNNPFNYSPGGRYFYFTSLLSSSNPTLRAIGEAGNAAVHANVGKLLGAINDQARDDQSLIMQALNFLKRMQQAELAQEFNYFKMQAERLQRANVSQRLTTFFQNNSLENFNYIEFLAVINEMYTDIDSFKKTIELEKKRLENLDTIFNEFEQYIQANPQEYDLTQTRSSNIRSFVSQSIKNERMNQNFQKVANYVEYFKSATIANNIQSRFRTIFDKVWKNTITQQRLMTLFEGTNIRNLDAAKKALVAEMVMNFMTTASSEIENLVDHIKNVAQQEAISDEVKASLNKEYKRSNDKRANQIVNLFFTGLGDSKTEQMLMQTVGKLKVIDKDSNTEDDLTRLMGRIFNNYYVIKYNNNNKTISGLTKEAIAALNKILDSKEHKKTTADDMTRTGIQKRVRNYLNNLQVKVGEPKITVDTAAVVDGMNSLLGQTDLVDIQIAKKDNLISEAYFANDARRLGESIGSLILSALTTDGQKIDTAAIEIANVTALPMYADVQKIISDALQNMLIQNSKISHESIQIVNEQGDPDIFNEAQWRIDNGFEAGEFSIEAETLRRKYMNTAILQQTRKQLEDVIKDEAQIEIILHSIQNSIKLGATVKSYNKYENNIGFHGGSIGGDLTAQLANITKMLSYGGITIDDAEWLTLAVYNTGAGMVGADLKTPLEAIFSAMGALLLFDDAGAQAQYIMDMAPNMIEQSSPQYLHLYHLNNLYIPSSFVLSRTIEAMENVATVLLNSGFNSTQMANTGVKATIENNVQPPGPGEHDMSAFFAAHSGEVNITLTFLAGFLDIVSSINAAIQ